MNYQEAIAAMSAAQNLNELKQLYRAFALQFHPDRGGSEEGMKSINGTFSRLFEILKKRQNDTASEQHAKGNYRGYSTTTETPEEFITIVEKLQKLDGIVIELCGSWLWISGDTRRHKESLKSYGCLWSRNKGQWYWRHEEDFCKKFRGGQELTLDEIRNLYGSQIIDDSRRNTVAVVYQ